MVAQVSGAEESMTNFITYTFSALAKAADFSQAGPIKADENKNNDGDDNNEDSGASGEPPEKLPPMPKFSPDFRFNIEIRLPSNGTEETYLAIFNALRKSLG
jgi:hypothetical protein